MPERTIERRLAAILSADVVDYSRLIAEDTDATVRTVLAYREEIEQLLRQHRARLVDFVGDNFMAEFGSVANAVQCAVQIQRTTRVRNAELPADRRVEFRMGVHLGDVQVEGEQIFGDGLNIAARLEGLADPGAICISETVHQQVKRGLDLDFQDLGSHQLKNIPDSIHLYQVSWNDSPPPETSAVVHSQSEPAVAVLPFVNMSADPDQEYFADGMAEELINALTQVAGLRVIARTSAFSFKGTNADIATIGKRLNVSAVVEGSVRKAGSRLRIAAQLIDVAGGHHLWSEVFDRPAADVFEIQDEIARKIVLTIGPKLLGESTEPLVTRPTESQDAYALYLRAGTRIRTPERWDLRTAVEMLKDATTIDPNFADAWARLALACCWLEFFFEPDGGWGETAEQALSRAFALDPDNPSAQCAHGRMLWTPRKGWQNREALRALASSLERQPGSVDALLTQGLVLLHVGLMDEARPVLSDALSAAPDDAMILNIIGQIAWYQGRYAESLDYSERSLAANPKLFVNHILTPAQHIYGDDLSGAEAALERARRLVGDDASLDASEALLWARRGEVKRADEMIARTDQSRASLGHDHHTQHYLAAAQATLGRPSEAIAKIRLASETGLPNYPLFLSDTHFDSLRDHPEMKSLMSELEADWLEFKREFGHS